MGNLLATATAIGDDLDIIEFIPQNMPYGHNGHNGHNAQNGHISPVGLNEFLLDDFLHMQGLEHQDGVFNFPIPEPVFPQRDISIEQTALQRTEYTQQHKDQGKVSCSVCLDDYVMRESLQQCPQCSQLFHEHCILDNLMRSRDACPLCRYDLVANSNNNNQQ